MSGRSHGQHRAGAFGRFRLHRIVDEPIRPVPSSHRTTFVIDGECTPTAVAPEAISAEEALQFSENSISAGDAAISLSTSQESVDKQRLALTVYSSPTEDDITALTGAWALHPMLEEDLRTGGQRPKLERYDDVLFVVARSARYLDKEEDVAFSEFHVVIKRDAIAVMCQDGRWITDKGTLKDGDAKADGTVERATNALVKDNDLLKLGPEAVLYRLLDEIVDGFIPVVRGIVIDKEQIEKQVFNGDSAVAERIYRLSQEVIDLQHATSSLSAVLDELSNGWRKYGIPEPLQEYLEDVSDGLTRVETRVVELRAALAQILDVNATLVAQRQNEDMKKISGWAAILFAPTLVGAIYGMNFDLMPELHWTFGYPLALCTMVLFSATLWMIFKRNKWM